MPLPAVARVVTPFALLALVATTPRLARAQDAGPDAASDAGVPAATPPPCPSDAAGCSRAEISFRRRAGLPIEFDIDTGWVPASSPVQVRFRTALQAHTEVRADGWLEGSWPRPMVLRAHGARGTGVVEADYGVVLDARVRLALEVGGTTYNWEGRVPYVPMVDFRARGREAFDPWGWEPVTVNARTMRQRLADVSLTDSLIPIPGISGGLTFEAAAAMETSYRTTRISFGDATGGDAITTRNERVMAYFSAGPQAEYFPRLEGRVDYRGEVRIYPGLYVTLFGRRWTLSVAEIPVPLGPAGSDWLFDPSRAVLELPDIASPRELVVDFGAVQVGSVGREFVPFQSSGSVDLEVRAPAMVPAPFAVPRPSATIPPRTMITFPVEFAPGEVGAVEQRVTFGTSDPDTPAVFVTLRGTGIPGPARDAGPASDAGDAGATDAAGDADAARDGGQPAAMAGGCGCRAAGSSERGAGGQRAGWLAMAAALGAVAARRRRAR